MARILLNLLTTILCFWHAANSYGQESKNVNNIYHVNIPVNLIGSSAKKGFICLRADDTPRIDLEWVKLLNKYNLRYSLAVNVPYIVGDAEKTKVLLRTIQEMGHELCDHTPHHNTLFSTIPNKYLPLFEPFIDNGITRTRYIDTNMTQLTFEYIVKDDYNHKKFGKDSAYKLIAGTHKIVGDFTDAPKQSVWAYINNKKGVKLGWQIVYSTTDSSCLLTYYDGTAPVFHEDEIVDMYLTTNNLYNITLSQKATYCLLLSGLCWFDYLDLQKPMIWVQPGGNFPFVDRDYLNISLQELGMIGGESEQVQLEQGRATYNYWSPYPRVNYNWDGGYLHFDACNGSEEWLNNTKGLISDYVAKRNIRTLATHNVYNQFPGNTQEEKRQNWLMWFDRLFQWISESNIPMLTLSERTYFLENIPTDKHANIFPELYMDRAHRGKPDGYDINNSNVQWTNNGLPESKNKCIDINGKGNMFTVSNLGGLQKGCNELSFYIKGAGSAQLIIRTIEGMAEPTHNPKMYKSTTDIIKIKKKDEWQKVSIKLDIPSTMNYITISFDVKENPSVFGVTNITLNGI